MCEQSSNSLVFCRSWSCGSRYWIVRVSEAEASVTGLSSHLSGETARDLSCDLRKESRTNEGGRTAGDDHWTESEL